MAKADRKKYALATRVDETLFQRGQQEQEDSGMDARDPAMLRQLKQEARAEQSVRGQAMQRRRDAIEAGDDIEGNLDTLKKEAKSSKLSKAKKIKSTAKQLKGEIINRKDIMFLILLIPAIILDLLSLIDFGIFSFIINICVYFMVATLAIVKFVNSSGKGNGVIDMLGKRIFSRLGILLLENFPIISDLPLWTGMVFWLWIEYKARRIAKVLANSKLMDKDSLKEEDEQNNKAPHESMKSPEAGFSIA